MRLRKPWVVLNKAPEVIITKMDETITIGSILNMLDRVKKPLSYVTFGQNVPNDIEVANPDKFVNLVLNW